MTCYDEGVPFKFIFVKKVISEHANNLFSLGLIAAIRSNLGFFKNGVVETKVNFSKSLFIILICGGHVPRQITILHGERGVSHEVLKVNTPAEDHNNLFLGFVYHDSPHNFRFNTLCQTLNVERGRIKHVIHVVDVNVLATFNQLVYIFSVEISSSKSNSELGINKVIVTNQITLDIFQVFVVSYNVLVRRKDRKLSLVYAVGLAQIVKLYDAGLVFLQHIAIFSGFRRSPRLDFFLHFQSVFNRIVKSNELTGFSRRRLSRQIFF
mmetsp:Transcript_1786/g.3847  ORF Transcript_1786/g.3847 Transcript_1786/m.3847 type:complete len:266 (-) Transcript_1786:344-1141(-)